mgnify:CR=1 FL=1
MRRRRAETGAERPREAAAVVKATGGGDFADHHVGIAQQVGRAFQPQPCRQGLRAFFVQALEGLGQVPAGEVGQLGQFADAHHAVAVAFQIETGALHATEHLALAAARAARATLHGTGHRALQRCKVQQHRAQRLRRQATVQRIAPQAQGNPQLGLLHQATAGIQAAITQPKKGNRSSRSNVIILRI